MAEGSTSDRRDLRYRALADPNRRHMLRILDDARAPLTLPELAEPVGLHVNTIRDHLDLMERAGLVERATVPRDTPGRPRVVFRSLPRDARSPTSEGYRFLAEILASSIQSTSGDPSEAARSAGRAWGKFLADRPPASHPVPPADAVDQVVMTLAELGFEPEHRESDGATEVRLHDCPFREIALTRGDVVCSVHEGLLMGMLEEMGGTVGVDGLDPFVEPSLCITRMSRR